MEKTGLPASVSIGQTIIETNYGKSSLARKANNYHGIKAAFGTGSPLPQTKFPEWSGSIYEAKDDEPGMSRFMSFENVADSFWTHDRWFCYWEHYHKYFKLAGNPREFLKGIASHYATDPSYFDKVWAVIEKYNLTAINKEVAINPGKFSPTPGKNCVLPKMMNRFKPPLLEKEPDEGADEAKGLLWYPEAYVPGDFKQITQGKYKEGYPQGAIVHWIMAPQTGGRDKAVFWAKWANKEDEKEGDKTPFVFFTIGDDGSVVQSFPLDKWGNHAGRSSWEGLGESVGQYLVGIEVVCEGKVTKFEDGTLGHETEDEKTGKKTRRYVSADNVRHIKENADNICAGYYQKYTKKQEEALTEQSTLAEKEQSGGI